MNKSKIDRCITFFFASFLHSFLLYFFLHISSVWLWKKTSTKQTNRRHIIFIKCLPQKLWYKFKSWKVNTNCYLFLYFYFLFCISEVVVRRQTSWWNNIIRIMYDLTFILIRTYQRGGGEDAKRKRSWSCGGQLFYFLWLSSIVI